MTTEYKVRLAHFAKLERDRDLVHESAERLRDIDASVRILDRARNFFLDFPEIGNLELGAKIWVRGELALEHLGKEMLEGHPHARSNRRLRRIGGIKRLKVVGRGMRIVDRAIHWIIDAICPFEKADHGLSKLVSLVIEQDSRLAPVDIREVVRMPPQGIVALQNVVETDKLAEFVQRLLTQK